VDRSKLSKDLKTFLGAYSPNGKIGKVLDVTNLLMAGQVEYGIKSFFVAWLRKKDERVVFALDKRFSRHEIDLLALAKGKGGTAIFTAEIKSTFLGDLNATTKCVKDAVAKARKTKFISNSKGQKKFLGKAAHFVIHFLNLRTAVSGEDFYPDEIERRFRSTISDPDMLEENQKELVKLYCDQGVQPEIVLNARNPHLRVLIAQIE